MKAAKTPSRGINDDTHDAFLWKEGRYVRLGERIFAGSLTTSAVAINDRSQIVGDGLPPDLNSVSWSQRLSVQAGSCFVPVGDIIDQALVSQIVQR